MDNVEPDFMAEARGMIAQCWCHDDTKHIEMDTRIGEHAARPLSNWMQTAAQHCRNEVFYREIVVRCGNLLGPAAKTCDDGQLVPDVLTLKVPEILEKLVYIDTEGFVCVQETLEPHDCPACNGKGKLKVKFLEGGAILHHCDTCKGRGRIFFKPGKPPAAKDSAGTPDVAPVEG